jgi:hypothetical protein
MIPCIITISVFRSKKVDVESHLSVASSIFSFSPEGGALAAGIICNDEWGVSNTTLWMHNHTELD